MAYSTAFTNAIGLLAEKIDYTVPSLNFKVDSKYTDPKELTAELLNDLVDKIVIHAPDKSSGKRRQKIEIYYKAAGIINIYSDDCVAEDGRKERWQKSKTA